MFECLFGFYFYLFIFLIFIKSKIFYAIKCLSFYAIKCLSFFCSTLMSNKIFRVNHKNWRRIFYALWCYVILWWSFWGLTFFFSPRTNAFYYFIVGRFFDTEYMYLLLLLFFLYFLKIKTTNILCWVLRLDGATLRDVWADQTIIKVHSCCERHTQKPLNTQIKKEKEREKQ